MPLHNGWLPREGLTADPIGRLFKRTVLNPVFPLAFILAARYTKKGSDLSILHETAYRNIRRLFYLGVLRWASGYLSHGALNNWSSDVYDWKKEIVLVTGGAGGIGGEIVKLFTERGVKVVVLDVIPMTFTTTKDVYYYKCDITSPAQIASVAAEIRKDVGDPTILINNAGVARGKSILDASEKDVRFTFDVNTLAHYFMAKEFVPSMVRRNHGSVVTVASYAAYVTAPNMTDYCASKSAAVAFHEGLAAELKTIFNAPKVRTILVNQGFTKTPLFQGFDNGGAPFFVPDLEPASVAESIVRQLLRGESGQIIIPGAGGLITLLRGFPHWLQLHVRNDGVKYMRNYKGRQVIDLDKWKSEGGKDKESGVSDSTVIVQPSQG